MKKIPVIFSLLILTISGCVFDSNDGEKTVIENDTGTYTIRIEQPNVRTYPTGGAVLPITFLQSADYSGSVNLAFKSPAFIHHDFLYDNLTANDSSNDLLLWVDADTPKGTWSCYLTHTFSGKQDSLEIFIEVLNDLESSGREYAIGRKNAFIHWYDSQNYDTKLGDVNFWCDYSLYPEIMIGGAGWVFVSDQWILRAYWSLEHIPSLDMTLSVRKYYLRKRDESTPTCLVKERENVFAEVTDFSLGNMRPFNSILDTTSLWGNTFTQWNGDYYIVSNTGWDLIDTDQIMIRFKSGVTAMEISDFTESYNLSVKSVLSDGLHIFTRQDTMEYIHFLLTLESSTFVESFHPDILIPVGKNTFQDTVFTILR